MPIFAALAGLSAASKLSIAGTVVNGLLSYKSAKQQRKQAISDQDNQYVRMRNAAQRAGFNPLTVMRATGGQGFTGLPTISKAAAFGNAAAGILDAVRQSPIDKYNKQVRDLEIKQRKADLELMPMRGKLMKAQLEQIMKPTTHEVQEARKNVLDGYSLGETANKYLATMDGNVTTDQERTSTETRVRPDGTKYTAPAGEDFDEQALNSFYYAGEQIYTAVQQLSKEGFKALQSNKKLNPNLPLITNKVPPLSKLNFGPNYADRMSLEGFAYNY
jgi:hypothetical protein